MSARIAKSNPAMKLILVSIKSFCSSSPWCADPCGSLEHRDISCWQEESRSSPLNYFYRRDFCPNVDYFWATRDFRYMWGSWVCAINPQKKARLSQIKCYVPFVRRASVQAVWWCLTHYRCQLLSVHFGAPLPGEIWRFGGNWHQGRPCYTVTDYEDCYYDAMWALLLSTVRPFSLPSIYVWPV